MDLHVGVWVALTEDGLWPNPFDGNQVAFLRKRDLVAVIRDATLDARSVPHITKIGPHKYSYKTKSCDSGSFDKEFHIVKVTAENFKELETLLEEE